ncbi:MAG: hypothetical protein CM15mP77_0610 [Synechococcus sp.]|nr:MAG: hypothetical protein CM15mP77_0610 [Synechococcus sp.]
MELLGISRSLLANPAFIGRYLEVYLWLAAVYWLACTAMALLARHLEVSSIPFEPTDDVAIRATDLVKITPLG